MSYWRRQALSAIEQANLTVPAGATYEARKAIIQAAYPFGERSGWPYKAWLAEQRRYLRPYDPGRPMQEAALFANLPRDPVTGRPVIR